MMLPIALPTMIYDVADCTADDRRVGSIAAS